VTGPTALTEEDLREMARLRSSGEAKAVITRPLILGWSAKERRSSSIPSIPGRRTSVTSTSIGPAASTASASSAVLAAFTVNSSPNELR